MGYISVADWRDLADNHLYRVGDPYPHDGREIDGDRINALLTGRNKAGFVLIRETPKEPEKIEPETAEQPDKPVEPKPKRTRKKKE